jgi:hypothetical protein
MTADEIAGARRRYMDRLAVILTAEQLGHYERLQRRLAEAIVARATDAVATTAEEQEALAVIEADSAARGLRAQLDILTRVDVSRQ